MTGKRMMINGSEIEHRGRTNRRMTISGQSSSEDPSAHDDMLEKLPIDMLLVILCCVASISAEDYTRCRLTCRTFYDLANENFVLQKIIFKDLSAWRDELGFIPGGPKFFYTLAENENPIALFQLGIKQFCTLGTKDEGLKNVEKASLLGYTTAKYALGVIKLGGSETLEGKDEVMRLIGEVKSSLGCNIFECRRTLHNRLQSSRYWQDIALHRYYPLPYTKDDHCDTCHNLSSWVKSAWSACTSGPFRISDKDDVITSEVADTAQCHACEWRLESKVFIECFQDM